KSPATESGGTSGWGLDSKSTCYSKMGGRRVERTGRCGGRLLAGGSLPRTVPPDRLVAFPGCGLIRATALPPSRGGERAQLNAARGRPGADVVVPGRCRSAVRCHALRHLQQAWGTWPSADAALSGLRIRPCSPRDSGAPRSLLRITNHESPIPNHPNAKRRPEGSPLCVGALGAGAGFEPAPFGL